jgi:sodium/pantothenate symporter
MILMIATVSAVNVPQQIVPLVSVSMGVIACCVLVPLIFGLYWERGTQTGFIARLLASFFSVVAWNFYGNPLIHPVFIGLVCDTAAYVIGSLATRGARRVQAADQSKAA